MSVGHVARLLEEGGIPTVIIASTVFQSRMEMMSLPRVLLTPHVMGTPVGPPGDKDRQMRVVMAALELLEKGKEGGTIIHFET